MPHLSTRTSVSFLDWTRTPHWTEGSRFCLKTDSRRKIDATALVYFPPLPILCTPRSLCAATMGSIDVNMFPPNEPVEVIFLGTGTSSTLPHVDCLTAPPDSKPCRTCLSTLYPEGKKNIRVSHFRRSAVISD